MYSKQELLDRSNQGLNIFLHYFGEKLLRKNFKRFKPLKNPFYPDKNASFVIYSGKDGKWRFRDFGNINYSGDVFDFVALVHKIDSETNFTDVLLAMNSMILDSQSTLPKSSHEHLKPNFNEDVKNENFELHKIPLTKEAVDFWNQYGITEGILQKNKVSMITGYCKESGGQTKEFSSRSKLLFAYEHNGYSKIYQPHPKKFWSVGKRKGFYVFGSYQLYESNILFIVGGEKDVLTLQSLGYNAICFNSETSIPSKRFVKDLYHEGFTIVVLYDNDETGSQCAQALSVKYGWSVAELKSILPENLTIQLKDISDYIKNDLPKDVLHEYLSSFEKSTLEHREVKNSVFEEIEDIGDSEDVIETLKSEDKSIRNESTNPNSLSPRLYESLPNFVKSIIQPFGQEHKREIMLLGSLAVLGNLLKVSAVYDRKEVFPNLFVFVTAPAASGKGILNWLNLLCRGLERRFNNEFQKQKAEFEEAKRRGPKPIRARVILPANSSVTAFCRNLKNSGERGIVLETEADSLNGVIKNDDWGSLSDVLRRAFEFEPISIARVDEDDSIDIKHPRLSVLLTGTKEQLFKLTPSSQNGLFSRFIFYEFPLIKNWENVFENGESLDRHYLELSEIVLRYYDKTNSQNVKFEFTQSQQDKFHENFSKWSKEYDLMLGEDSLASVKRMGNIHYRISMLLATIRMLDEGKCLANIKCSDTDFEIATELTNWLLGNTRKIFRQLPTKPTQYFELKNTSAKLYDSLPDQFDYQTAQKIADVLQIKNGTLQKYLKKLRELKLVIHDHNKYTKTRSSS